MAANEDDEFHAALERFLECEVGREIPLTPWSWDRQFIPLVALTLALQPMHCAWCGVDISKKEDTGGYSLLWRSVVPVRNDDAERWEYWCKVCAGKLTL